MLRIKQTSTTVTANQQRYVPLKQINIEAYIRLFAANVTIKQIFRNDETTPIDTIYHFPIEERASIYAFMAYIDGREIIAKLKDKEQTSNDYHDNLQQTSSAYLFEQDEKSQDIFIINIGVLSPGKECHIHLSYVTELALVQNGKKIQFIIPTTIVPRSNSQLTSSTNNVQSVPYKIELYVRIDKLGISSISSSSHPIEIDVSQQDIYIIKLGQKSISLDRDILIDIELLKTQSKTRVIIQSNALMLSFTPYRDDYQRVMNNIEINNEFIFLVDCSGSMTNDNKIDYARQAMLLFLKNLPIHCQFNIIRFGSRYETLFDDITMIYNKENTQRAEEFINDIKANLSGTELLLPLQWLADHPPEDGHTRQIFLLTDSEISNTDQVLNLCRRMSNSTRIFSFGLGRSPSCSLVKGLARTTNGHFVFIPPDTSIDTYVGEQLEKALQPAITNIQIKWNLGQHIINSTRKIPPVYVNDRLIAYAFIESNVFDQNSKITLYCNQYKLDEVKLNQIMNINDDDTIARLATKACIYDLQYSKSSLMNRRLRFEEHTREKSMRGCNDERKRIMELSLKYQILSPHTAWIGIERHANGYKRGMILRQFPIQISIENQYLQAPQLIPVRPEIKASYRSLSPIRSNVVPSDLEKFKSANHITTKYLNIESPRNCCFDRCTGRPTDIEKTVPRNKKDTVRYLINKQKFSGLWDLTSTDIEHLIGKPLSYFQQTIDGEFLISAIVIVTLETQFSSFSSMWHGIVEKGRKRLLYLMDNDQNKLNKLLEDIQKRL